MKAILHFLQVETLESQTANYSAVVSSLNDQIADLNASAGDSKAEVARLKKMVNA